jgi:acetaldehyde dehydrogenase (acetylating)
MNKSLLLFLCFFVLLIITSWKDQSDIFRGLVIVDCQTQEMIPGANVVLISKDTAYHFNTDALMDTLSVEIADAVYRVEVMAAGYKKFEANFNLTKSDTILTFCLIPINLDSITVNWEGAIISIEDSAGYLKCIRHKP